MTRPLLDIKSPILNIACTLTDTIMLTSYDTACQWLLLKMPGVFTALPSQRSRHRIRQRLYYCAVARVLPGVFTWQCCKDTWHF
jgi:hypothetical protein